jgi:ABC-type glutathione transport system ATPase component
LNVLASTTNKTNLLGRQRPKPKKMWQRRFVKVLVVGDSGLGKTTLVRCLLAVPGENMVLHDGSSTSFEEFKKHPSDFLSTVEWDDADDHVHWVYQVGLSSEFSRSHLEALVRSACKFTVSELCRAREPRFRHTCMISLHEAKRMHDLCDVNTNHFISVKGTESPLA